MKTRYVNARHISGEAYDLEECPLSYTLGEALSELRARVTSNPVIAPYLQTLKCKVDADVGVQDYEPVRSGMIVLELSKEAK